MECIAITVFCLLFVNPLILYVVYSKCIYINPLISNIIRYNECIPLKHPTTGKRAYTNIIALIQSFGGGTKFKNLLFDAKRTAETERVLSLFGLRSGFAMLYPILCSLFFRSGTFLQSVLVLCFFSTM